MVLQDKSLRNDIIQTRDPRICFLYADWLDINNLINTNHVSRKDGESCRQALNRLIRQRYPDKEDQLRLLSDMEMARDENIIPLSHFTWLQQDERATFWLWGYLFQQSDFTLGLNAPMGKNYDNMNWYKRNGLPLSSASHQERLDIIIRFFDDIIIYTPPVNHHKQHVLDNLKEKWKTLYNKPLPLKWLPNEEEAVLWAWNTLEKAQHERNHDRTRITSYLPGLTTWFTPINPAERYLALRAAFDLWEDEPDSKRLLLLNFNKAWNQRKLRQSRTDKKALNTYLKNDTKLRLDFIAEHQGLRISDILEKLINDHYRETFGGE
ncbi:hypothetical protein I5M86_15560 [Serratia marcescens]|nr:hypothetical protein [Serratia marcescens]MBH3066791.1 hypothetical protein [Serratia marcescens]